MVGLSNSTLKMKKCSSGAESVFYLIDDAKKCRDIDFQSENWKQYPDSKHSEYQIFEQRDAKNKSRGIIKITKKSQAKGGFLRPKGEEKPCNYIYFAKRNAPI